MLVDGTEIDYSGLPANHRESIRRYIEGGCDPSYGLRMILAHDLQAVTYCDDATVAALPAIYRWMHNHAPSKAHGSYPRVAEWMRERRAAGSLPQIPHLQEIETRVKLPEAVQA